MKVSLNWLYEFGLASDKTPDELIEKIGNQLGAVEEVINLGERYKGIVIVKVVSCDKHENADTLHVCKVDDNSRVEGVDRDENGYVQVVCGAPNVQAGQLAVWLPKGVTIPSTIGKDRTVLEAKEIRGVISNGMLASAKELGIGDSHVGIVVLNPNDAKPGDSFAEVYRLNDYIIDIENKMFTHRPDCFGQLGVAREVAGITGQKFNSPGWYLNYDQAVLTPADNSLPFTVTNELPDLVPRFMAIALEVGENGDSPFWLQTYLSRVGTRPINHIVDITNYMMLLTAQPLHAYDYDKVKALCADPSKVSLVVRYPKSGETIKLLGGKEITPKPKDIMIATDSKLIGIGGVMGGADTEVDNNTKRIILECANFDMYSIRRSGMANGLFTEAVTRFNKGQSRVQNDRVLARTVEIIKEKLGGKVASELIVDCRPETNQPLQVLAKPEFINSRLGSELKPEAISELLTNVEFEVSKENTGELSFKKPFWRTDIAIAEDIVEEVGRLYGYDNLKIDLPKRNLTPASGDPMLSLKTRIRNLLVSAGANEVLTYSFVHSQLFEKADQDKELSFQLANAISPSLQHYRLSLLPSLLDKIHPNIKAGHDEFVIFELNKVHIKGQKDETEPDIPAEEERLALVVAIDDKLAKAKYSGAPYYHGRRYIDFLLNELGIKFSIKLIDKLPSGAADKQALQPFEMIRTGLIVSGDESLGVVGEPKNSVKANLKLPGHTAIVELDLAKLLKLSKPKAYTKMSNYPKVQQDVCFRLPAKISYQQLLDLVVDQLNQLSDDAYYNLTAIDIYQKPDDSSLQQITFRVSLNSYKKTLTSADLSDIIAKIGDVAKEQFEAEII